MLPSWCAICTLVETCGKHFYSYFSLHSNGIFLFDSTHNRSIAAALLQLPRSPWLLSVATFRGGGGGVPKVSNDDVTATSVRTIIDNRAFYYLWYYVYDGCLHSIV